MVVSASLTRFVFVVTEIINENNFDVTEHVPRTSIYLLLCQYTATNSSLLKNYFETLGSIGLQVYIHSIQHIDLMN